MKTLKLLTATLALSLVPGLAIAQCTGGHSSTAQMSCAEGTMFDPETGTCEPVTTG